MSFMKHLCDSIQHKHFDKIKSWTNFGPFKS